MDAKTQHGYLVLADISGFTSYLAGVELEHASGILSDLLETICFCQLKREPLDSRKGDHFGPLACTLTTEKGTI